MLAGIIGGTGQMGRFFAEVFEAAGWETIVSGTKTSLTARAVAETADLVMVSVPIRATVDVIREVAPLLSDEQVFCDLTSLKVEPVRAMLASRAEVIGLHPMFGPGAASLRGQTIVATPARCSPETLEGLLSVFRDQGAAITLSTPEDHDRMMAVIQGLTHFGTLAKAEAIRRTGADVAETLRFTSPVYRIEMGLVGRLLAQDAGLYGDMLQMNPAVPEVLAQFEEAVRTLREIIESGDAERFREFFAANAGHYASYLRAATEETDDLISHVVSR
ncbi:prephenate dehydrogenase/arogenate dehydrogenase family protein [Methanoculleus sp. FWC-SCC3]|uniref:Prephenate dehydrogenase/arogenate dehydrogenase family protein n=1 Tax=Methanoculleus methanifontis TaxID=2584086 RepID=A0ABT8M526_9EURY|nr:prephenate dehydrogenase/arogenate dehydrogenase family protein [Methanoculleus sp. FWC-SCC3]MDN7013700.1 prephenate dehydrogenase/arogenate dehydrogenase family protein [Methanoculleus sp. FWC-SCC3]